MSDLKPEFLFLDIETTGLDPSFDLILELGMILTDSELTPIRFFSQVIHWPEIERNFDGEFIPPFGVNEFVTDMHTKNGLWKESYNSQASIGDVISNAIDWLEDTLGDTKLPMTGNTINFDKSFLMAYAPKFVENCFDYHLIDISTIKFLYQMWVQYKGSLMLEQIPVGNKVHRSIPDCHDSIAELKFFKDVVFNA